MMETKLINKVKVEPIQVGGSTIKHRGHELFSEQYPNIFLLAKKKSGKTTTLAKILLDSVSNTKKLLTNVIIFSSTANKDDTMKWIIDKLEDRGIPVTTFLSIEEHGVDLLKEWMNEQSVKEFQPIEEVAGAPVNILDPRARKEAEKPVKQDPPPEQEFIIVFDDMGAQTRRKSVSELMQKNRHFKCKVIIASQNYNNIDVAGRLQLDYILIWPNLPLVKLEALVNDTDISLDSKAFIKIYKEATKEKHNFLYVDIRGDRYRHNFDREILLS